MTVKNLFIAGIFGLLAMDIAQAAPYQTLVHQEGTAKIELVSWCSKHPWHRKCRAYRRPPPPYYWYGKHFRVKAHYCRYHPYKKKCWRFCHFNPGICYR